MIRVEAISSGDRGAAVPRRVRLRWNQALREGRLREGRLEKLTLAKDRQDLCDRLAAWNALRERDRWKGLDGHWNFSI